MSAPSVIQASDGTPLHTHRCMRCGGVFTCRAAEWCIANYDVMPIVFTLGPDGRIASLEHCAQDAAGKWVARFT